MKYKDWDKQITDMISTKYHYTQIYRVVIWRQFTPVLVCTDLSLGRRNTRSWSSSNLESIVSPIGLGGGIKSFKNSPNSWSGLLEMGRGKVGKGKGDQIYGHRGNATLGGEHTIRYSDNVLLNYTLET